MEWIMFAEKKPPANTRILVCDFQFEICIGIMFSNSTGGYVVKKDVSPFMEYDEVDCKYWMHLPETPTI